MRPQVSIERQHFSWKIQGKFCLTIEIKRALVQSLSYSQKPTEAYIEREASTSEDATELSQPIHSQGEENDHKSPIECISVFKY